MPPTRERLGDAELQGTSTSSPSTARHRSDGSGPEHSTTSRPSVAGAQRDLGPVDLARHAVDQVHGRARLLQVHEVGEVDATERRGGVELLLQERHAAAAGEPGVDPTRQRDDQHRVAELRQRVDLDHRATLGRSAPGRSNRWR